MGSLIDRLRRDKSTREVLALIFTVVAGIAAAGWAIFTYIHPPPKEVSTPRLAQEGEA